MEEYNRITAGGVTCGWVMRGPELVLGPLSGKSWAGEYHTAVLEG